jgi:hypothetical protein
MPNLWMYLRFDQLIPVNKKLNKKEQFEKGMEEEEEGEKNQKRYLDLNRFFVWKLTKFTIHRWMHALQ